MNPEPFAQGASWIHHIEPRLRIVAALLFSTSIAVFNEFEALASGLTVSALLVCMARLNLAIVAKRLLAVSGFLALIWVILPLTYNGEVYSYIGPVGISVEGLALSARISLKAVTISMAFVALIATMSTATLGHSLGQMGISQRLVILFLMTYRYLFVLEHEYQRLRRAAKIRGFNPGTNMHTYRTYAYLLGMLLVRASQRAERVHQAMRCRGFHGRFYTIADLPVSPHNHLFAVAATICLAGLLILELRG